MKFLRLLSCWVIIGALASCDPPDSKKRTYETLVFDVDQTRLEPAITDAVLNITMSAPKEWTSVDDSMLARVIDELGDKFTQGFQMMPRRVFVNEASRAMCVVSNLEGVEDASDKTVLESLETAYRTQFPKATDSAYSLYERCIPGVSIDGC